MAFALIEIKPDAAKDIRETLESFYLDCHNGAPRVAINRGNGALLIPSGGAYGLCLAIYADGSFEITEPAA